ncbi:DNA-binding transcriptional regulator, AcrR family [Micromonospora pallida]|uniref:DNA-binding transcriptional regulator, AcrR family n=1 Tax=Micromonospora pallida TaxID=145854 RepID=A0A1C6T3I3_9ACTN|nr:TetR/AcrR family transcriptional regulator [Micromonospora pallida]SCL36301.1 DNA-binding transcriptional regulator, AcrR family [Micromonospora pallida]
MPRVSPEHLAARRQQIVDAAGRCFLRNGFHQTTMQDVIAEAELSVGAVYRYFPSKHDLIAAIAESVVGGADRIFAELAEEEPPLPVIEVMDRALDYMDANSGADGRLRIALQVWAESLRDPALAEMVASKYAGIRAQFAVVVQRAQRSGELPSDADVEGVAAALFGLVLGYLLQRILTGRPDRATYFAGLRALLADA